ncbi:mannosyltransferase [Aequorivita xiaoshiensis]|uniref:Mannosyltransferase n=1 Tax=Aequorivita xiaoshiensis TaxID=2874476 RepID=A0A9X1R476_9FLAO|nr:mannosyltransferase [Aequorivita xiaoshiensis]MCG2430734.1 mannosyltransferase [Aequorivita xiaoshiensis]
MNFIKTYKIPILVALVSIVLYLGFAYILKRSEFVKLISLYAALYITSYLFIEKYYSRNSRNFRFLTSIGIVFRLALIVSIPNLSQDFYRFLWDGRLLIQGFSPYLFTPATSSTFDVTIAQSQKLIEGMGSLNASHFSNYPPVNQLFFAIAALFAGKSILGSVIVLRMVIILADVGILYFGKKVLEQLNLPVKNIFWYFLSPFIIIELTGNLHFEGVMLFFFVWALYLLFKRKWLWAAVLIGLSISVKLLPLLLLPLFFRWFSSKEASAALNLTSLLKFYSIIGVTILITFLPFFSSEFIQNFAVTIGLWFQNFEFNASVYYIIRWIGFQVVGWNIIGTVGKILPMIVVLFILGLSFLKKNRTPQQLITSMLFAVSFYFLLSTTVHPWYIATPLILSVFTNYKFPIVWSFVVVLSYSAYGKEGFDENLWLVALEYFIVIGIAAWEFTRCKKYREKEKLPNY